MIRILLVFILINISFQCRADAIIIGVSDQAPQALGVENGRFVGNLSKHYQCVIDNSGLLVEFHLLPQSRLLLQLERGEIDIGLPLARLKNRDEFARFTNPMLKVPFRLYTLRDLKLSDDLSAYTFAVMRASASMELVAERGAKFREVNSRIQALDLAKLGRFDGAVIPLPAVQHLAQEYFEGLTWLDFGSLSIST